MDLDVLKNPNLIKEFQMTSSDIRGHSGLEIETPLLIAN